MSNLGKPSGISLLVYNVGFGDCFLLRFEYGNLKRHILIDFGSTAMPSNARKKYMTRIAESIQKECGGKLDALVATHRHADHISGFDTESGPGAIIAACKPSLVLRGWTEDPSAAADATGPITGLTGIGKGLTDTRNFIARLDNAGKLAFEIANAPSSTKKRPTRGAAADLNFMASVNSLPNQSAITNLESMAKAGTEPARYVYYGAESGLEKVLPNVKVSVLGPPTLDQSKTISSQMTKSSEFWMLARLASDNFSTTVAKPDDKGLPPYARWLKQHIDALNLREMLEIVRQLDDVLNNTSVILLFEVGKAKLLFSGDAQIENWNYALDQPGMRDRLKDVTLYKVGHHGSRNATPKTMWDAFAHKTASGEDRLITILSTKAGKHGSESEGTEVPRKPLVEALKAGSEYYTTEDIGQGKLFQEIRVPA
jgi:hypothetical protein